MTVQVTKKSSQMRRPLARLYKAYTHTHTHNFSLFRRRSLQYHYASSLCKPIKCPKGENGEPAQQKPPADAVPGYFDCDPDCQEPTYWYFRKGEILVSGKDYGGDYI